MRGCIDIAPADFREVYRIAYALAENRLMHALKAADITAIPVHCVRIETDLIATAALLAEKGISGSLVTDRNGSVVGVISEKDFLREMGAYQRGSFMKERRKKAMVGKVFQPGCRSSKQRTRAPLPNMPHARRQSQGFFRIGISCG